MNDYEGKIVDFELPPDSDEQDKYKGKKALEMEFPNAQARYVGQNTNIPRVVDVRIAETGLPWMSEEVGPLITRARQVLTMALR